MTLVQDNSESTPVHNLNFDIEYEFLSLPQEYYISLHYAVPLHKYIAVPNTPNTSRRQLLHELCVQSYWAFPGWIMLGARLGHNSLFYEI